MKFANIALWVRRVNKLSLAGRHADSACCGATDRGRLLRGEDRDYPQRGDGAMSELGGQRGEGRECRWELRVKERR